MVTHGSDARRDEAAPMDGGETVAQGQQQSARRLSQNTAGVGRERHDAVKLIRDTEAKLAALLEDFREQSKPFNRRKKTLSTESIRQSEGSAGASVTPLRRTFSSTASDPRGRQQKDPNEANSRALLKAGRDRDLAACKSLLEKAENAESEADDVDVDFADENGDTCLMHLLFFLTEEVDEHPFKYNDNFVENLHEIIFSLLQRGANVNRCNRFGQSPMWIACNENKVDILQRMVDLVHARRLESPAFYVPPKDMVRVYEDFIMLCPNPNQHYSVKRASNPATGEKAPSSRDGTLWHLALTKDSMDILRVLLEAQVQMQVQWRTFIEEALAQYPRLPDGLDERKVLKMTNREGNPDAWAQDGSPVHAAIRLAQNETDAKRFLTEMLNEHPMDDDKKNSCTLFDPNAVDASNFTSLHQACLRGYDKCIEDLMTYQLFYGRQTPEADRVKVDINRLGGQNGLTALMCAVKNGHTATVRELFEQNALGARQHDLSLRERSQRQTALHLACAQPKELDEVVAVLCKSKASVNLKDNDGYSPLHLASMHGHVMIVKCLLKYNANAAALTNNGKETALHIAAAYGHINILSILLRKGGAEVGAENKAGRTALHHAFKRHTFLHSVVEQILEQNKDELYVHPGIQENVHLFLGVIERRTSQSRHSKLKLHARVRKTSSKIAPQEKDEPLFDFDNHRDSPHHRLKRAEGARSLAQSHRLEDLENLFLEINNQNMLIKLLLEAGGDLDHEDNEGDPAFMTRARFDWFDMHEDEMTDIFDRPNEIGYDSEIFMDKRTQYAVRTVWISTGMRTKTMQSLISWMLFLALLTTVAIRYSGRNNYESFSMQAGIIDRVANDEWDEADLKGLADVGNLDDWRQYVNNVVVEALWESDQAYVDDQGVARRVGHDGALLNGLLGLLGRPRYRQLRTRPTACASATPSILAQTQETCFGPYTRGTYREPSRQVEDRTSFSCPLSNGTDLLLEWEENPAFPVFGKFGYYQSGGFSVVLPADRAEVETLLADLDACNFLSLNTRFAVIEFTFYSRSEGLFTHGSVYLEMTAAGGIFSGQRWETRRLVSYSSTQDMMDIWVEVLVAVYLVYYFSSELRSMLDRWGPDYTERAPKFWWPCIRTTERANKYYLENQKTFRVVMDLPVFFNRSICMKRTERIVPPYWVNPFNYVDICIMVVFVALISVHAVVVSDVLGRIEIWQADSASDAFIDISGVLWLAVVRQHLLAFTVFLCYIKSLEYLQISASMAIPVIIIGGMLHQLLSFFLIFAVFILAFGLFDYVLYGLAYEPASSVLRAVVGTFRASLGDLDFDGKFELDHTIGVFMTVLSASLLVILLLNLLIAIMNEAYEETKESAEARWCYMQFRMIVEHQRKLDTEKALDNNIKELRAKLEHQVNAAHLHGPNGYHLGSPTAARPNKALEGRDKAAKLAKRPSLQAVQAVRALQHHRHDEDGVARVGSFRMRSPEPAHSVYLRAFAAPPQGPSAASARAAGSVADVADAQHPALAELSAYLQQRAQTAAAANVAAHNSGMPPPQSSSPPGASASSSSASSSSRKRGRKVVPHQSS